MNERIKELYKEATGKSFANDFDARVLEAEKFAELIVRDVAKFVGEQRNYIPACGFEFEAAIKEHFGVEECL